MHYQLLRYSTDGPLAWLSLNRPDKLNAINAAMIAELHHALDRAESDPAVRVILLTGEGRAFSAGFDLDMGLDGGLDGGTEQQTGASADQEAYRATLRSELTQDFNIIMRFWDCPKPTIAAVHTYCLGSAMEMALACDITIAASDCRLGAPEVKFGSGIVALVLPWFCGPKKAKELLLTGTDRLSAAQAQACGLVNQVVPAENLLESARAMAMEIAANDQLAVRLTKQAVNRSMEAGGMRKALLDALETDVEIESTDTSESRQFNAIMKTHGTRAAIAWRKAQVG